MTRFHPFHATFLLAACAALLPAAGCSPSDDTSIDVPRDTNRDDGRDGTTGDTSDSCGHEREPCCGGSACGPGLTCSAGTCTGVEACGREGQPCCSGMACASDLVCTSGDCVRAPDCGGERQPCCSGDACRAGLVCERAQCVTPAACGGSRQPCCGGTACASGLVCTGGTCETAPTCGGPRQPCCSGTACNEGLVCSGGTCNTAPEACGGGGQPCCGGTSCTGAGLTCCERACVDTARDPRNCGTCGNRCTGTCSAGSCVADACGAEGQPCCTSGERCRTGLECNASSQCARGTTACGPVGTACAAAGECCAGLSCRASPDTSFCCVEANGTCTSSSDCCGWMSCVAGRCACESGSDVCVATADCCAGLTCIGESCTSSEPADPCADSSACGDCTTRASCGWCKSDGTCRTGGIGGPSTGTCGDWAWYSSACSGTATDPCAANGSCDGCTTVMSCGWCADGAGGCSTGTGTGPDSGSCGDWRWYSAECVSAADPCAASATCGACTVEAGCGWCEDSGACRSGSYGGPTDGACGDWKWLSSDCATDDCAGSGDCATCTTTASCGWCEDSGACQTGSYSGPAAGSCGGWVWYSSACTTSDPCNDWYDCGTCTGEAACGWCRASWTCMTGGPSGPDTGSCSDWDYNASDCLPPPDPCNDHGDCGACTGDAACGWCEDDWTCMSGGPSRPDSGLCSDWRYYASDCAPPPDPCDAHGDCGTCTGDAACGWCEASWTCRTGGPSGPDSGSCSDWDYNASDCPPPPDPCNEYGDCGACTGASACGWCEDDWTCMTGGSGGPTGDTCVDWRYLGSEC